MTPLAHLSNGATPRLCLLALLRLGQRYVMGEHTYQGNKPTVARNSLTVFALIFKLKFSILGRSAGDGSFSSLFEFIS